MELVIGGAFQGKLTWALAHYGLTMDDVCDLAVSEPRAGAKCYCHLESLSRREADMERYLPLFENVDVIQIGARNMQNYDLLKEMGSVKKPILLKRGLANTLKELLMSAEYIMASGNDNVILCERGIRTFDDYTRNTLDLSAVPMLHELSHLPVVVDPSHATGISKLVKPMAFAATAAGADGLIIEVHNDPEHALCDGPQSLTPEAFDDVVKGVNSIRPFAYKM